MKIVFDSGENDGKWYIWGPKKTTAPAPFFIYKFFFDVCWPGWCASAKTTIEKEYAEHKKMFENAEE